MQFFFKICNEEKCPAIILEHHVGWDFKYNQCGPHMVVVLFLAIFYLFLLFCNHNFNTFLFTMRLPLAIFSYKDAKNLQFIYFVLHMKYLFPSKGRRFFFSKWLTTTDVTQFVPNFSSLFLYCAFTFWMEANLAEVIIES